MGRNLTGSPGAKSPAGFDSAPVRDVPQNQRGERQGTVKRIVKRLAMRVFSAGWVVHMAYALALPRWLRDPVYDWVERNRSTWFGQLDACPTPPADMRARYIH